MSDESESVPLMRGSAAVGGQIVWIGSRQCDRDSTEAWLDRISKECGEGPFTVVEIKSISHGRKLLCFDDQNGKRQQIISDWFVQA